VAIAPHVLLEFLDELLKLTWRNRCQLKLCTCGQRCIRINLKSNCVVASQLCFDQRRTNATKGVENGDRAMLICGEILRKHIAHEFRRKSCNPRNPAVDWL